MRQILLDTETTGLRTEDGHRIIEIGCLEMINRRLTGNRYHQFINPEREVEAGALAVHGISNEFLRDKPVFKNVLEEFMAFISDAELIIHNAPFDIGFLNYELSLARQKWKFIQDHCAVIDTLEMARKLHPGQRNSLDALCKRYAVDNSRRDLHGALIDANLLAQVYLAMTGGQGSFFDAMNENQTTATKSVDSTSNHAANHYNLTVLKATETEIVEHQKYIELLQKKGKCVWND